MVGGVCAAVSGRDGMLVQGGCRRHSSNTFSVRMPWQVPQPIAVGFAGSFFFPETPSEDSSVGANVPPRGNNNNRVKQILASIWFMLVGASNHET